MTRAQADCVKDVEDVRAGGSTFRPERIAPCLAKTASLLASCPKATFDVFYQLVADAAGCQTFEGSRPQAAACERDSQCKPSTSPTELVFCAGAPKTCTMFRLLPAGAACKIGGGDLCAKGLFCDADFALMPPIGTCKAITPLGSACDAAKAINLACGPSNYCDKSTAKCAAGKDEGACQVDAECATGVCLPTSKTCKRLDPLLKTEDCRGF